MTIQTLSIQTEENNSTYPTFAPHQFLQNAEIDYFTMRLLTPYASLLYTKIAHNAAECLEKVMKAFLIMRGQKTAPEVEKLGHNLENIRIECIKIDDFFNDPNLEDFCKNYSGDKKGNEVLRYGYIKNTKGYGINLDSIIQLTDKFFLGTFLKIDNLNFAVSTSNLASLFYPTNFQNHFLERFTPQAISQMRILMGSNNQYLDGFIKAVEQFCLQLENNKKAPTQ